MHLSTQEQIIALYSFFPERKFDFDTEKYHGFFYRLKREQMLFFQNLHFDSDGRFPTSPDLLEIEGILISTVYIWILPHNYQQRIINPVCKSDFERNLRKQLTTEEVSQLELNISKQFAKALDVRPLFDDK